MFKYHKKRLNNNHHLQTHELVMSDLPWVKRLYIFKISTSVTVTHADCTISNGSSILWRKRYKNVSKESAHKFLKKYSNFLSLKEQIQTI